MLPQQIIGQAAGGIKLALLSGKERKGFWLRKEALPDRPMACRATNVPVASQAHGDQCELGDFARDNSGRAPWQTI